MAKDGTLDGIVNSLIADQLSRTNIASRAYDIAKDCADQELLHRVRELYVKEDPYEAYITGREYGDEKLTDLAREILVKQDPFGAYLSAVVASHNNDEKFVDMARDAWAKENPWGAYVYGREYYNDQKLTELARKEFAQQSPVKAYFVALFKDKELRTMAYKSIVSRVSSTVKNILININKYLLPFS